MPIPKLREIRYNGRKVKNAAQVKKNNAAMAQT
jgi:hypothetical protein